MKKIYTLCLLVILAIAGCSDDSDSGTTNAADGKGGSLAIFALKGDYLYSVDNATLNVFSLIEASGPVKVNDIDIGFNIETLFADGDYLYVGSQNGMYLYSIANPENPQLLSRAEHFTSCDPVVANTTHAFVTLHSNTFCGNNLNVLHVYNIADKSHPQLIHTRNLVQPKGLGLYGSHYLIICDDEIKIFDIANPAEPVLAASINKQCNDVIINGNTLFAIGDTAVYNYTLNPDAIGSATLNSQVDF